MLLTFTFIIANIPAFITLVIVIGIKISFIAATKCCFEIPFCSFNDKIKMYISSTPSPSIMKGRVHATSAKKG